MADQQEITRFNDHRQSLFDAIVRKEARLAFDEPEEPELKLIVRIPMNEKIQPITFLANTSARLNVSTNSHLVKMAVNQPEFIGTNEDITQHFEVIKVKNERGNKVTNFVCNLCSRRLENSSNMRSHVMSNFKIRPFRCFKCKKAFT